MLVYSHRGLHLVEHENTHAAFAAARALGVDGIETDVQLDRHGEAILYHDRLGPQGRPVEQFSRSELSAAVGYEIPKLDDALAAGHVPAWNLEIKHPSAVPAVVAAVRMYAHCVRFLVTSFWHTAVDEVCASTACEGGLLVAHYPRRIEPSEVHPARPHVRTIVWNMNRLDAPLVTAAGGRGLANWVYALESRGDHELCRAWGCDCVVSDRPDWLLG